MKPLKNVPATLTMNFTFSFALDSGRGYNFTITALSEEQAQGLLIADLHKMRAALLPE